MNPLISSFIGTLLRRALGYGGAFLVARGLYTTEEMTTYIAASVGVLLDIGWSFWQKHGARADFVNALKSPKGTSEDQVKAMAPPPEIAKKVIVLLLALGMSASTLACASRGPIHLQVASYGAEMTKIAVQAQTAVLEADKSGLQPNKELTRKANEAFRQFDSVIQKLATALEAYDLMVPAEQQANLPKIDVLLAEARRLVRAALLFGGSQTESLGGELLKLFDNLDNVFNMIQTTLRPVGATS